MVVALLGLSTSPGAVGQTTPSITSPPPANAIVGNSYAHQFTSNLPDPPATYSVTSGALPPGVTMSPAGIVSGAPSQAGSFGPTTVCASNGVQAPACQTFTIVVARRTTQILGSPSPGGPVGTAVRDTASLLGFGNVTGSVTFRLFSDANCTNQVFTSTNVVDAQGVAISDDFVPLTPGTYRWTIEYSGDVNNLPATLACSEFQQVTITGTTTSTTSTTSSTTSTSTTSTTSTSTTVLPATTT